MKKLIIFALMALFLSSCAIEKRRYTKGFHVDWLAAKHKVKNDQVKQPRVKSKEDQKAIDIVGSDQNSPKIALQKKVADPLEVNYSMVLAEKSSGEYPAFDKHTIEETQTVITSDDDAEPEKKTDLMSIFGFSLSTIGAILKIIGLGVDSAGVFGVGWLLGIFGLALSFFALGKVIYSGEHKKGFAIAGVSVSGIFLILLMLVGFALL